MIFLKRFKRYIVEYTKPIATFYRQYTGQSPILHHIQYGCYKEINCDGGYNLSSDWTYDSCNIYLRLYHTYELINEVKLDTCFNNRFQIEEKITIFRILKERINGYREPEQPCCWGDCRCRKWNIFQHATKSEQDLIYMNEKIIESKYCIYNKRCECGDYW